MGPTLATASVLLFLSPGVPHSMHALLHLSMFLSQCFVCFSLVVILFFGVSVRGGILVVCPYCNSASQLHSVESSCRRQSCQLKFNDEQMADRLRDLH